MNKIKNARNNKAFKAGLWDIVKKHNNFEECIHLLKNSDLSEYCDEAFIIVDNNFSKEVCEYLKNNLANLDIAIKLNIALDALFLPKEDPDYSDKIESLLKFYQETTDADILTSFINY